MEKETPSTAFVDAHQGWGHYAARWRMNLAMEKARATGIGVISMVRPTHLTHIKGTKLPGF